MLSAVYALSVMSMYTILVSQQGDVMSLVKTCRMCALPAVECAKLRSAPLRNAAQA